MRCWWHHWWADKTLSVLLLEMLVYVCFIFSYSHNQLSIVKYVISHFLNMVGWHLLWWKTIGSSRFSKINFTSSKSFIFFGKYNWLYSFLKTYLQLYLKINFTLPFNNKPISFELTLEILFSSTNKFLNITYFKIIFVKINIINFFLGVAIQLI